jgi:3-hydroxyisobutyrate dehydrogenase-like beta-hydroxyacid dehydrogenase
MAFIGVGAMGGPMAGYLAKAGYDMAVFDLDRAKAEAVVAEGGGRVAESAAEAAAGAEFVFTSVVDDVDLRPVTSGSGGTFEAMATGGVHVDHTTVSATISRLLAAEAADRGVAFLDAPVTGSVEGARAGTLSVMVGGEAGAFARAESLMRTYARDVRHMGPSGAGQFCKMTLSVAIAGIMQGLIEGLTLAHAARLDADKLVPALAGGSARSWWLENRAALMMANLEAVHNINTGRAGMLLKDLGLALVEARACDVALPLAALVSQFPIQPPTSSRWPRPWRSRSRPARTRKRSWR